MGAPPPIALSLLVCERAISDARTGQTSLIGIISHVLATSFPTLMPSLSIYFELTNGRGEVPIRIRVIDANELRDPVFEVNTPVSFEDPLAIVQISMGTSALVFSEPGEYFVQIWSLGELLLSRRIMLVLASGSEPGSR